MSVNLEETAMLSWNQPVVEEPVVQESVKEEFVLPDYMQSPATVVVVEQPVNLDPIVETVVTEPPIVIIEPVVEAVVEAVVDTTPIQSVVIEPNNLAPAPAVNNLLTDSDIVIPLEGMKPTGDITQEDLNDISCSQEETQTRLAFCKTCPEFKIENMITKCSACDCSISMVTTFKYKACPAGNW